MVTFWCLSGWLGSASVLTTKEGSNEKHSLVITKSVLSPSDCVVIVKELIVRAGMSVTMDPNILLGPEGYRMRELLSVAPEWVMVESSCAILELYINQISIEQDLISALAYVDMDGFLSYLQTNGWDYDPSCSICIVKRGGDHNQTFGNSSMKLNPVDVAKFLALIELVTNIEPTVSTTKPILFKDSV